MNIDGYDIPQNKNPRSLTSPVLPGKKMEQISFASKRARNSWAIRCGWLLEALVQMIPKRPTQRCSKILAQSIGGKDILIPDVFQIIVGSKPTEHVIV